MLEGFTYLEPFGTDARYVRFLQGTVAPRLKAFAGADVSLDAPFEASQTVRGLPRPGSAAADLRLGGAGTAVVMG